MRIRRLISATGRCGRRSAERGPPPGWGPVVGSEGWEPVRPGGEPGGGGGCRG